MSLDFVNCGDVWVNKEKCIRSHFSRSHCRECEEICVVKAIIFSPQPSIDEKLCLNCGLCHAACPFSAITIEKNNEKIIKETADEKTINIGCIFSESSIKVSCISRLTEDLLFYFFSKEKLVVINKGNCKKCKFNQTMKFFYSSLKKSVALSKAVGKKPNIKITKNTAKKPYIPKSGISRREIFSALKIPGIKNMTKQRDKREILLETLKENKISKDTFYPDSAKLTIKDSCILCGVCEYVCPAGAIIITKTDDKGSLYFDPSVCINCKECEEACLYSAIELKEGTVADILKKPIKLFEAERKICKSCSKEFFSTTEADLCPTCKSKEESKNKLLKFLKEI